MAEWKDKRITILGLGRSGLAAASYLAKRGAKVLISESTPREKVSDKFVAELKALGVEAEYGAHSERATAWPELILTSPGIPPYSEVIKRARSLGKEVISDIELAYRELKGKVPFIAITGTNGKSTTTSLISYMLERTGLKAPACGNIGRAILSLVDGSHLDYLVVEVSSYQLEYSPTFAPEIALWLNLTPDHLDFHGGLDGYVDAKRSLFAHLPSSSFAVFNMDDSVVASTPTNAEIFPFSLSTEAMASIQGAYLIDDFLCYSHNSRSRVVCNVADLKIIGKHNLENALAAISACCLAGLNEKQIEAGLISFTALEHRLEYVDTVDGVEFYNDSKATNTDSTIKALEAFPGKKVVLIAGGKDKGTSLNDLVQSVKKHAASVILLGEAKERIERALREVGFDEIYPVGTMEEAVQLGGKLKRGPVLLSPACASFDMFKDFEDRGRVFKDLVRARAR
ncbi:MAG: UDP-N-acetylmuramoyl-L-alanine--D-glutamate ligase [Cyanobacteria bacterium REEB67]|nr:UDP-N-acetylmuramoyl-L-alanine--D-glutamate ligase [Cyanobacteria bacterium REEB67]